MEGKKKIIFLIIGLFVLVGVGLGVYFFTHSSTNPLKIVDSLKQIVNLPTNKGDGKGLTNDQTANTSLGFRTGNFIKLLQGLTAQETSLLQETKNYLTIDKLNSLCEDKKTATEKESCLTDLKVYQANIVGRPELCDQTGEQHDACLLNMAFKYNKAETCELIKDMSIKNNCQDSFKLTEATQTGDLGKCLTITDKTYQTDCTKGVFQQKNDLNFCDNELVKKNSLGDLCRSVILMSKGLCDQIPLADYKNVCLVEFK